MRTQAEEKTIAASVLDEIVAKNGSVLATNDGGLDGDDAVLLRARPTVLSSSTFGQEAELHTDGISAQSSMFTHSHMPSSMPGDGWLSESKLDTAYETEHHVRNDGVSVGGKSGINPFHPAITEGHPRFKVCVDSAVKG